jgi:hypothetical protein
VGGVIEKWWQFTCDRCEETTNSVMPDMTVAEFRRDEKIVRRRGEDLCKACARARAEKVK